MTPIVVYPLLSVPGRDPHESLFSEVEYITLFASVVYSRFHFANAVLLVDTTYKDLLEESETGRSLLNLFTSVKVIESGWDSETRAIFWSTEAKRLGLMWALEHRKTDQPILLMDADCIIFNPANVIAWDNPKCEFAAGYTEPLTWEVYRNHKSQFGNLVAKIWTQVFAGLGDAPDWQCAQPVNAGCLYFNCTELVNRYVELLGEFIRAFKAGEYAPMPYYKNPANPAEGLIYFSEVMMADQRLLGMLLYKRYRGSGGDRFRVFTEFSEGGEFPVRSSLFLHLWKLKGDIAHSPIKVSLLTQYILACLNSTFSAHGFLSRLGYAVLEEELPMTSYKVFRLVKF